mgnify:CR=1 FL=1
MGALLEGVNWIAVVVGTVVSFLVGWLWYSPILFGPRWAQGVGVKMGTADDMPFGAMAGQILGLFLMSWLVGVTAASNALMTSILAVLAFTVLGYSGGMFRKVCCNASVEEATNGKRALKDQRPLCLFQKYCC